MSENPVILFDGVCNLCNGFVQFVIRHDPEAKFRFAPLQSEFAQKKLSPALGTSSLLNSVVLMENGKVFFQSTAALKILKGLKGVWKLSYVLILVPPFIRNFVYRWVAKNRYRWFGKRESCMVPTKELLSRFLS